MSNWDLLSAGLTAIFGRGDNSCLFDLFKDTYVMGPLPEVLMSLDSPSSSAFNEVLVHVKPTTCAIDSFCITVPNWYKVHQFRAIIQKHTSKLIREV